MRIISTGAAVLWIAMSFAGLAAIAKYKGEPGSPGVQAGPWPAVADLPREAGKPTLVLFLHPQCPCSRSTVGELIAILSRAPNRANVRAAFYQPESEDGAWGDTDISRSVADLPGVTSHRDPDGREARAHGVATSGHVLLYDAEGRLAFSGGITAARGHLGDNPGRQAVIDFLLTGTSETKSTPVYGCAILDDHPE